MRHGSGAVWLTAAALGLRIAAAGAAQAEPAAPAAGLSPAAQLGRLIFFDPGLSAAGSLSCASCHDPAHAYTSRADGLAPAGGAALDHPGMRMVPSLRYLDGTPRFTRHFYLERGEEREDLGPAGGFMLDGRADSLHAQALLPWLDADEMANASIDVLARRLRQAPYAQRLLAQATGVDAAGSPGPQRLVAAAAQALERFELEDPSFHPYSSRYDAFLEGRGGLSEAELRGLRLFVDPRKGNCAECHPNTRGPGGRPPDFTDYGYRALGVPRNRALSVNADPAFFDMGLCGPLRLDLKAETRYCGYFKTPTLRNSARRKSFFHNGRFQSLEQVLEFYAERDTAPQRWYRGADRVVRRFDDLPARYRDRVDTSDAPFNRQRGDAPSLSAAEIGDLEAFLRTLDDAD